MDTGTSAASAASPIATALQQPLDLLCREVMRHLASYAWQSASFKLRLASSLPSPLHLWDSAVPGYGTSFSPSATVVWGSDDGGLRNQLRHTAQCTRQDTAPRLRLPDTHPGGRQPTPRQSTPKETTPCGNSSPECSSQSSSPASSGTPARPADAKTRSRRESASEVALARILPVQHPHPRESTDQATARTGPPAYAGIHQTSWSRPPHMQAHTRNRGSPPDPPEFANDTPAPAREPLHIGARTSPTAPWPITRT